MIRIEFKQMFAIRNVINKLIKHENSMQLM
jgi:hypothetical protein